MRLPTLLLLLAPMPALAQAPTSPDEFEAMSEGRTLHFTLEGQPFGAEQYFPGRRSLWRYEDGSCVSGSWTARGDLICFDYEGAEGPVCWHFLRDGSGVHAALIEDGAPTGFAVDLDRSDTTPLDCPGPKVGS